MNAKRLAYGIGVVALLAMAFYLVRQEDVIQNLELLTLGHITAMVALSALASFANGARFAAVVRMYGLKLPMPQWYALSVTNTMLNYALPAQGGTAMKGAYMKKRYGFTYTAFASLTASSQLVTLACAGLLGLTMLLWWSEPSTPARGSLIWGLGAAMAGAVLAIVLLGIPRLVGWVEGKWGRRLQQFASGFRSWMHHPTSGLEFAFWSIVWTVLQGVRLWVAFTAVGMSVEVWSAVLVQSVVVVAGVVSIIPGNLGLREGVTSLSAGLLGLDPAMALLASLVDRAISVVFVAAVGVIMARTLAKKGRDGVGDSHQEA